MKRMKPDLCNPACPSRTMLAIIASKWSMLLLHVLAAGPVRTGELKRAIGGISQKMLTQTLRELESIGVVQRKSYGEVPPKVEYALTPLGRRLAAKVVELDEWILAHFDQLARAQKASERRARRAG